MKTEMLTKKLVTDLATTFEAYRHIEYTAALFRNRSDVEELRELGYKLADLQRRAGIVLINAQFLSSTDFMERWGHIL